MATRVLLVDDHEMFRRGLRLLLEEEPDLEVVGEAGDGARAIEMARDLDPDVVVMDVTMPGVDGVAATREILAPDPGTRIVALSAQAGRPFVGDMLRAGARGYVLKASAPEDLVEALRTVARGDVYLSPAIADVVVSEIVSEPAEAPDPAPMILRTKLHVPPATPDLIPRTRLVERWEELKARPLTLISCAAGYGKSTLASQWLQRDDGPHAWLSLDAQDDDPRVFLAALVAAIRVPFPEACDETASLLEAGRLPSPSLLGRQFLNDLDAIETPLVLVLDDYHQIDSAAVHDLLTELLTHPPRRVHLILLTRRDPPLPLGVLRGRGHVTELGVRDLRFSVEETALFLENILDFPVDGTVVKAVQEKLEGWPSGMRLMARSLRQRADLDQLLSEIEGGFAAALDYLLDEVLARQPRATADLMVEVSLLDRFCVSLCDAIRDPDGGGDEGLDGQAFLAGLRRDNLFLVSLDAQNRWFRFHHLFQDLLRTQLSRRRTEEEIANLHARASRWLADNGHVEEAIRHALAAGDLDGAERLVEEHRHALLEEDRWFVLERWLAAFPREIVHQRPVLLLSLLWVLDYRFDHEELAAALDEADALVGAKDPLRIEVEIFRGYLAYFDNDAPRSIRHLRAARDRVPDDHHEIRAQCEMLLGLARQLAGEGLPALERLGDQLYRGSELRGGTRTRLQVAVVVIHLLEGRLPEADAAGLELHGFAAPAGYRHAEAWGAFLHGLIHLWRNELDEAVEWLQRVVDSRFIIEGRAVVDALTGLALAHEGAGRPDLADESLKELLEFADSTGDPSLMPFVASGCTRLALLRGDRAARMPGGHPPPDENMAWWIDIPAVTWCRTLIAEGSDESLRAARERLEELRELNRLNHNVLQTVDVLALLAVAQGPGGTEEGVALARQAVELAGPGGIWRPFVEAGPPMAELLRLILEEEADTGFAREALAAVGWIPSEAGPSTADCGPLTGREVEILRLVAEGLSNKQVAARIYRSIETVKKHLYNTYQKLEVDGRTAAVARARELGILPG